MVQLRRIPIESRAVCVQVQSDWTRASVASRADLTKRGAALAETMDGQAALFRLHGDWMDGRLTS